jgi:hypothetical protein
MQHFNRIPKIADYPGQLRTTVQKKAEGTREGH